MPSREMQGNKNVNTFNVSHSKHIHQPAPFPRLIQRGEPKKIKKCSCYIVKTRAFFFVLVLTQFSTERRRGCYAICSLPNPIAWLFLNVRSQSISLKPFQRMVCNSVPSRVHSSFFSLSNPLFTSLNKSSPPYQLEAGCWGRSLQLSAKKTHKIPAQRGQAHATTGCVLHFTGERRGTRRGFMWSYWENQNISYMMKMP